jgi:Amt family ammonium transporter
MTHKFAMRTTGLTAALVMLPDMAALAQDASAGVPADTTYVLNTLLFLMAGFMVMWMAAGFTMLEAGMVRTRSPVSFFGRLVIISCMMELMVAILAP